MRKAKYLRPIRLLQRYRHVTVDTTERSVVLFSASLLIPRKYFQTDHNCLVTNPYAHITRDHLPVSVGAV